MTKPTGLRANGLKKITVYIHLDQYVALRSIALEQATDVGGKPDSSLLLRNILDAYLEGRAKFKPKKKRTK